jgi:anthranilate phosphoribosyltransferase
VSSVAPPDRAAAWPLDATRRQELPDVIRDVLIGTAVGEPVSAAAIATAFGAGVDLAVPMRDVVVASLLTAVMARGPEADDVEALLRNALALDRRARPEVISDPRRPVLLMAGSGKKGVRTVNVSTPDALVAAAAGANVLKVGSAAASSAVGSRDLVRVLGLPERRTAAEVRVGLATSGFAFVAVEPEIPLLDRVYGGRFHVPNPFSFGLAPLASPVRGDVTVFGLAHPRIDVAAEVLSRFGLHDADVLCTRLPGGRYLDEVSPVGEMRRCRVRGGEVGPAETWPAVRRPNGSGLPDVPAAREPGEAVERARDLLAGRGTESHRAAVALTAGHLLHLGGVSRSWAAGTELAGEVLRSGAALPNGSGR